MAILDPLTGLHNRRYMTSHLATLFDDASRRGKPLSLLLIDIDHFKGVNDSHGHDAGDAVLREFATRIRRDTRGIDLARLGGEEFVVVMPDCDLAKAYQVGERLRQCIEAAPFEVGGKVGLLQVTAIGVAALEFEGDAPEHMLKRADQALYCAKRDGRNRVVADAA
jgi:two-component system cell cycle response regulator